MQPGITGLWQVEARDKPDFEIYRRLDLFYVENWSIGLDLAIMFSTVCSVLGRVVPHPEPAPAALEHRPHRVGRLTGGQRHPPDAERAQRTRPSCSGYTTS